MQLMRKITVAGINNVRGGFTVNETDAPRLVSRIYGLANAVTTKESNFGPYLRFTGEFRAINADGEECAAPVLMLPAPADELLAAQLGSEAGKNGVQFAFDVFIVPMAKKTPIDRGYAFQVKPLMETAPSDPLKALAASLPAIPPKALPAPVVETVDVTATENTEAAEPTKKGSKK